MNTIDTIDYICPSQDEQPHDVYIEDLFDEDGSFDEGDCAGI